MPRKQKTRKDPPKPRFPVPLQPTAQTAPPKLARCPGTLVAVHLGGLASCGMLAGLSETGQVPAQILTPDTGSEERSSDRHREEMAGWLRRVGFPSAVRCRRAGKYASLESECRERERVPVPGGLIGGCDREWKRAPVEEAFAKKWAGTPARLAFPLPWEERHRAAEVELGSSVPLWFPLVAWAWTLDDCRAACARQGVPTPVRPGCFLCPCRRPAEVSALSGAELSRAVAIEVAAKVPLGNGWAWSAHLNARPAAPLELAAPPAPPAWCRGTA